MHLLTLLLVMLFALVIAYFCYSVYFYGGRWVANPYNPRISSQKQHHGHIDRPGRHGVGLYG